MIVAARAWLTGASDKKAIKVRAKKRNLKKVIENAFLSSMYINYSVFIFGNTIVVNTHFYDKRSFIERNGHILYLDF